MDKTKKNFRLLLDNWYNGIIHKHKLYRQRTRGYGSYLYSQDKDKFNMLFELWETTDTKEQFESKG